MNLNNAALRCLLFIVLGSPLVAQGTGNISGTLAGDDGTPIVGVVVANGQGVVASARGISAADGTFTIIGLPVGTYTLCARPNGRGYLDPCTWSIDPAKVSVAAGTTAKTKLVVSKGAIVHVRLNDPLVILGTTAAAGTVAPHVLLSAQTPRGLPEPLVITARDAAGMDYQTTIPFNTPVTIRVSGKQVGIQDSQGKILDPVGDSIVVQRAPTDALSTVTLQVSKP